MALQAGTRLGAYEVLSLIGAGGMGEVYRARDTRLGREVAIKVLPADRVSDAERRRRFVQEAQAASALNHPHIITIHEIESADGNDFIVMEYVRGKSLDALIPRQGLRLNELLRTAIPVADALAAAHAGGIIHRDLKPANVMVGDGGAVKVLDFGLAKLVADDSSPDAGTVTHVVSASLSAPGAIMGTAAYMAPEQATGGSIDARSDIFSFGAMLYEMVTGTRAFAGASVADTLAAVLRSQPTPPAQVVTAVPRELERLILRCLRKEPERRYQTMLDVSNELQEIKQESLSGTLARPAAVPPGPRQRRVVRATVMAAAIILVAAGIWRLRPPLEPVLPAMRTMPLTSLNGLELGPSLSSDGEQVAFSWQGEKPVNQAGPTDTVYRHGAEHVNIYLKQVGSSDVRRLTTDPGDSWAGAWSPDGRQIACFRVGPHGGTIFLISPVTGTERKIVEFPAKGPPLSWSADGRGVIVAGERKANLEGGIYFVPVDGGAPRLLLPQPKTASFVSAAALAPDGQRLAYVVCGEVQEAGCDLDVVEVDERWHPAGTPRLLANRLPPINRIAWSRDSTSVFYTTEPLLQATYLSRAWVAGTRPPERLELAGLGARMPAIASTRDRLAFTRILNTVGVYTLEATPRPVLLSSLWDIQPQFSPDGTTLVFTSSRSGDALHLWIAAADGSNAHQLTHGPGSAQGSPAWSPDGRRIAFDVMGDDGRLSIWTIDADGGAPRQMTQGAGNQQWPSWSRDGRWIYFRLAEGTSSDTWKVPAAGGPVERVTREGSAGFAVESMDGKDLIDKRYDEDSPLLALPIGGGPVRQLLPCVHGVNFAVGLAGIYYAACGPGPVRSIHLFDRTARDRVLGRVRDVSPYQLDRLAVSPNGKTILIQQQTLESDLVLIDNFR